MTETQIHGALVTIKMALFSDMKILCHLELLDVTALRQDCLQTPPPLPLLKTNKKKTKLVGSSKT